jgi:hypothetical protein
MWTGGLYYPYMRIRDENWLKASVLYWDSMRRFQPPGYPLVDSPTSIKLVDAGFLRSVHPEYYSARVSAELMHFMRENIATLRDRFSVDEALVHVDSRLG